MKCEVCLELLEEYLDGELVARESREVAEHLITCVTCSSESAALVAEQEMFSHYDRELEVTPIIWEQIVERTVTPVLTPISQVSFLTKLVAFFTPTRPGFSLVTVAVLVMIAIAVGATYLQTRKQRIVPQVVLNPDNHSTPDRVVQEQEPERRQADSSQIAIHPKRPVKRDTRRRKPLIDQSDVLSSDFGYQDLDDKETARHLEQTQNLLRSIRNVRFEDPDQVVDVTYDKALSRKLLNENIVLRRDAEMRAKFPAKVLLSDLEPFLIDIANLPDQAKPEDVRVIKERVQKTEIVAALMGY